MDSDDQLLLLLALDEDETRNKRRRKRRWYVREINRPRNFLGEFANLIREMRRIDHEYFRSYFRMIPPVFDQLLAKVRPFITHKPTHKWPIPPDVRLAFTLRYLASGDITYGHKSYLMAYDTARKIVHETTEALWLALHEEYLKLPDADGWLKIADQFWSKWNMPACLGAIDGKHVVMEKPKGAGSELFNYKKDHSIILMAIVDADYKFVYVDIGAYGRENDAAVFERCEFGKALLNQPELLNLPDLRPLPGTDDSFVPHFFIADNAFPLCKHFQVPIPGENLPEEDRTLNYRLSRARRTVESGFGIAASRFRVLRKPIKFSARNAEHVVKAVVVLHNYLRSMDDQLDAKDRYIGPGMLDHENGLGEVEEATWRTNPPQDPLLASLSDRTGRGKSRYGTAVRDRLKEFFMSPAGSVYWQHAVVTSGRIDE